MGAVAVTGGATGSAGALGPIHRHPQPVLEGGPEFAGPESLGGDGVQPVTGPRQPQSSVWLYLGSSVMEAANCWWVKRSMVWLTTFCLVWLMSRTPPLNILAGTGQFLFVCLCFI